MADENKVSYVVTGPMAMINCANKRMVTVMRGGPVPPDALPEAITHLLEVGLIEEGDIAGGPLPSRPGDGTEPVGEREAKAAAKADADAKAKAAAPAPAAPAAAK